MLWRSFWPWKARYKNLIDVGTVWVTNRLKTLEQIRHFINDPWKSQYDRINPLQKIYCCAVTTILCITHNTISTISMCFFYIKTSTHFKPKFEANLVYHFSERRNQGFCFFLDIRCLSIASSLWMHSRNFGFLLLLQTPKM